MLRVERDPAYWTRVVSHPSVAHVMQGEAAQSIATVIEYPSVIPLAMGDFGGYIYIPVDSFSRTVELHTLVKSEAWGRRAIMGGAESLETVFANADLVVTHYVLDWPRSKPWAKFGFSPCGAPFVARGLNLQTWMLPKMTWEASSARRKLCLSSPPSRP